MRSSLLNLLTACFVLGNLTAFALPIAAQTVPGFQTPASKQAVVGVKDILAQSDRTSAAALMTQPMSISRDFSADNPAAPIEAVAGAIPSAKEQAPQLLTPFDVLKNPNQNLERFLNQAPPTPETPAPLEFFKIPGLEGSLKMNVSNF